MRLDNPTVAWAGRDSIGLRLFNSTAPDPRQEKAQMGIVPNGLGF